MIIHFFIVIGEQKENQQHQLTEYNEIHVSASPGGGDSHMKKTGMLVVSLRGVNFGFWSRLGRTWDL